MEEEHRKAIQKAYVALVERCNIDALLPVLEQKKVFSPGMISDYSNVTKGDRNRKRQLFLDIQRRGPHAFSNLIAALRETGQTGLANLLEPANNGSCFPQQKHAVPFMLPPDEDVQQMRDIISSTPNGVRINLGQEPIKIKVEPATELFDDQSATDVDVYSTHSRNRGAVLIINNITYNSSILYPERKGAEVDGANLQELFTQMGLKVEMHGNLTGLEMEEVIQNFKSSKKIKGIDMVFIIIMGHGFQKAKDTYILGVDNTSVSAEWVETQFNNANCKVLQKRPKIIMYQTCRGQHADFGVANHIEVDSAARTTLRTCDDMLIAHSTLPGNASHRDIYLGTWYISLFCEVMMTHACTKHVEEIFKMVDSRLAQLRSSKQTMQTSIFTNVGFKNCYIHPMIYMEDSVIKNIYNTTVLPDRFGNLSS